MQPYENIIKSYRFVTDEVENLEIVARENYRRITTLVTKKNIVIHGNPYIILYILGN